MVIQQKKLACEREAPRGLKKMNACEGVRMSDMIVQEIIRIRAEKITDGDTQHLRFKHAHAGFQA